jgi:hypothetical protein
VYPFTLERPRDLGAALILGAQAGRTDARIEYIAGGTDMVQQRSLEPASILPCSAMRRRSLHRARAATATTTSRSNSCSA